MTEVEKKLKRYADCGCKLYKLYAQDEDIDPAIPDFLDWLGDLYDDMTAEASRIAMKAVDKNADFDTKYRLNELNKSRATAQEWFDKSPGDMPTYYLARIFVDYEDLDIEPIEEKYLDIVKAEVVQQSVKLTPIGQQIGVYAVPVLGSWHCHYIPFESTEINGYQIISNPDTLERDHLYVDVKDEVVRQSHVCRDCGQIFYIPPKELRFFADKKLDIPKRCRHCRALRKK